MQLSPHLLLSLFARNWCQLSETYFRTMLIVVTCFAIIGLRELFFIGVVNSFVMLRAGPDQNGYKLLFIFTAHPNTKNMQQRIRIRECNTIIKNQYKECRIIHHYVNCHRFNFIFYFSDLHFKVFWDVTSCNFIDK